jgi:2-dehydropantoate 2-reductase
MSGPRSKILVMGAGGIGGITSALLTQAGHQVLAISTNQGIRDAVRDRGMLVTRGKQQHRVMVNIESVPKGIFDTVILATQPPTVEEAARVAAPHLAPNGNMLVLQNGLCEQRVAMIVGAHRVIGAIVAWGASMPAPGHYEQTATGGFSIGRLDGSMGPALCQTAQLLAAIGPTRMTGNLAGARWSKLALNCAISSIGTIAGQRLGRVVNVRRYRRLALDIMTEVVAVARASSVTLEKISGTLDLNWIALTPEEKRSTGTSLATKHALLFAVGMKYRKMRSSMLAALERGRIPAIDFLCGEVVHHGKAVGVATPVNQIIVDAVWSIARGQATSSWATLDNVAAQIRAVDDR